MNASELKLKIFRQIDSLEKTSLETIYGMLSNLINSQKEPEDWILLSEEEKKGIADAFQELDAGEGHPHDEVMDRFRQKYSRA